MALNWKAVQYMIYSVIAFALMNLIIKYLNNISVWQQVFFRAFCTLLIIVPLMQNQRISLWGNKKPLLILRGVVGTSSLVLFFMAIKLMPIGTCVTLRYLSPIFAAAFAFILIKESVHFWQWVFFIISFCGVFLIKGFDDELSTLGVVIVIISGALSGLVLVIIRKIGNADHPLVIIFYFMVISSLISIYGTYSNWIQPNGIEWILLSLLGVLGLIGQYFMTVAVQLETTDVVAPMKYLEIPATILVGITFFGESYGWASIGGFTLIISGLIANILFKQRHSISRK